MHLSYAIGGLGLVLVILGHGLGLFWAPKEAMMGDVGRILYVHVPTAWVCLVIYLSAFIAAVAALWTNQPKWDARTTANVEVGTVLNIMLLIQGSIWARPTWGVWWTWDPRLTTAAVMVLSFGTVLVLRQLIDNASKRLAVTAVATVLAFVNVPIVYMSVKWWRTLHQNFSSPETVDNTMVLPLRIAAFGMLFLAVGMVMVRSQIEARRLGNEDAEGELPELPPAVSIEEA